MTNWLMASAVFIFFAWLMFGKTTEHTCHDCPKCAKIVAEQKANLETFKRLYIEKGNRFERHIKDATKWQLPMAGGTK